VGRILKAFRGRFESMLKQAGARRPEKGAEWLIGKARRSAADQKLPLSATLTQVYHNLQRQCLSHNGLRDSSDTGISGEGRTFWCDSGLGGLARWLRAGGYDALWHPRIHDDELLNRAGVEKRTLLTTDSGIMERRLIRDRIVPALWLPPTLEIKEQMRLVIAEYDLRLKETRCTLCGGELRPVDKESVQDRIPPKTWRWLDEYFLCTRCDHLFWRGTHWQRIRKELEETFNPNELSRANIQTSVKLQAPEKL
jgi:uncharacterized protein